MLVTQPNTKPMDSVHHSCTPVAKVTKKSSYLMPTTKSKMFSMSCSRFKQTYLKPYARTLCVMFHSVIGMQAGMEHYYGKCGSKSTGIFSQAALSNTISVI